MYDNKPRDWLKTVSKIEKEAQYLAGFEPAGLAICAGN